jgi:hypothetical protein
MECIYPANNVANQSLLAQDETPCEYADSVVNWDLLGQRLRGRPASDAFLAPVPERVTPLTFGLALLIVPESRWSRGRERVTDVIICRNGYFARISCSKRRSARGWRGLRPAAARCEVAVVSWRHESARVAFVRGDVPVVGTPLPDD